MSTCFNFAHTVMFGLTRDFVFDLDVVLNCIVFAVLLVCGFRTRQYRFAMDYWLLLVAAVVGIALAYIAKEERDLSIQQYDLLLAIVCLPVTVRAIQRRMKNPEVDAWLFVGNPRVLVERYMLYTLTGRTALRYWDFQVVGGTLLTISFAVKGILGALANR